MDKLINELKDAVISYLEKKPQGEPYLIYRNNRYTAQDCIDSIANNEEFGLSLIRNSILLSIDRFDRLKDNFQDFTKL